MKILLLFLLLGCCFLECSAQCTPASLCQHGIAAKDPGSGAIVRRFQDTQAAAESALTGLTGAAGFTAVSASDACGTENLCGLNSTCTSNTSTVFICDCDSTFEPNRANATFSCSDIDECSNSSLNNCSSNATCTNGNPLYSCACNAGFTGDGENCTDIKECSPDPCPQNSTCDEPVADNYTCTCVSGYGGDPNFNCTDINECATGTNNCHANAGCTNTDSSFMCACNVGYTGNGTFCEDIIECASNPCHADAICAEPTVDNYTCTCNLGYTGDGYISCTRAQQTISITFSITCANLTFNTSLQDSSTYLYGNVTGALLTAISNLVKSVDNYGGVENVTYAFTNSSDGYGVGEAEVTLFINNTTALPLAFYNKLNELSETAECGAIASADECSLGVDNCDSTRSCSDSAYGFCCYHDLTYTASVRLNYTYNATMFSDINSTDSRSVCSVVEAIIQRLLDAKENRGCSQSVTFTCEKLIAGSVEAVLQLGIANATYTADDIANELKKAENETTIWGAVLGAGDFDECSDQYEQERNCSEFAECLNFAGNFTCDCNATYFDNGTEPGKICIAPVTVNCSGSSISISILSAYYTNQGILLDSLRLADDTCNRTTNSDIVGDSIEFTVSVNACNTTLTTASDNSTIVASNYITNVPTSGVFTGVNINIPFQCELPGSLNISAGFTGVVNTVNLPNVVAVGGFSLDFQLFNSGFSTPYGSSKTFGSNEIIYGQIEVGNGVSDVSVVMDRCWGTPSSSRTDPEFFEYLAGGCSNGKAQNLNIMQNGNGAARFSFQMFFFTQVSSVYLHCDVRVCTPSCATSCSKRRRRNVLDVEPEEKGTITILLKINTNDPIFIEFKNSNSSLVIGTNQDTKENNSQVHDITLPIVAAILAFVLIVLLALLVVVAVRKHRASKDMYDMTHVNMHAIGVKPPAYQ